MTAIFDLDGTLIDSMSVWNNVGKQYLCKYGIEAPEDLNDRLSKMSLHQCANYFIESLSVKNSAEDIISEIVEMVSYKYFYTIPMKKGIDKLLHIMKAEHTRMAIATATDRKLAEGVLRRLNIMSYFEFILTCQEEKIGKDTPLIFEKAMRLLDGKKHDTLVFEDAPHAIETAKKAGFTVVGVYDKSADQNQVKSMVDYYGTSESLVNIYKNIQL